MRREAPVSMLILPICAGKEATGAWAVCVDQSNNPKPSSSLPASSLPSSRSAAASPAGVWQYQDPTRGWVSLPIRVCATLEDAHTQSLNRVPIEIEGRQSLAWLHRMVAIEVDNGN